jgi:hypothetical protein
LTLARPRVRTLTARLALASAGLALAGCAAHCLRDSDCEDGYECRRDRCQLVVHGGDAGLSPGAAGQAGSAQLESNGSGGGGAGGSGTLSGSAGVGGSAIVTDAGAGGSATGGRENLDASGG